MFLLCAGGEHPVDIAGEHVDFDIELSSGVERAKRRVLRGMRDDVDRETGASRPRPATSLTVSETPSSVIEPFGRDHRAERARDADARSAANRPRRGRRRLSPTRVDMAGDDMAAELVAEPERALEVELRAFAPEVGGGLRHGLARNIDREPVVALVDDGQADARAGDRRAEIDRARCRSRSR